MSYLKIGYLENNLNINIFNNNNFYKYLFENNILPVISILSLLFLKNNYNYTIHNNIPDDFDINIYKLHEDLKSFSNEYLYKHFVNYGQYEGRIYNNTNTHNCILPQYIRDYLEQENLLYYFDIPCKFNIYNYKKNNSELENLNDTELVIHWINYGQYENKS